MRARCHVPSSSARSSHGREAERMVHSSRGPAAVSCAVFHRVTKWRRPSPQGTTGTHTHTSYPERAQHDGIPATPLDSSPCGCRRCDCRQRGGALHAPRYSRREPRALSHAGRHRSRVTHSQNALARCSDARVLIALVAPIGPPAWPRRALACAKYFARCHPTTTSSAAACCAAFTSQRPFPSSPRPRWMTGARRACSSAGCGGSCARTCPRSRTTAKSTCAESTARAPTRPRCGT